jgi:hypothetical protein
MARNTIVQMALSAAYRVARSAPALAIVSAAARGAAVTNRPWTKSAT